MNPQQSTITLTFGDQAENHVGMEQLGELVAEGEGFQYEDLTRMYDFFASQGVQAELYHLHEALENIKGLPPAYLLVLRKPTSYFLQEKKDDLFAEQASLPMDKQAFMYGRVVNKHARWNLCFDDEGKEPNYEEGRGRVIAWNTVPLLKQVYSQFPTAFGPKATALKGEGNYYYDIQKCGIGFHGDSERRKVIALRLGASMTLYYQWFLQGTSVGPRLAVPLHDGDMYVMSEKAVGTDWKRKTIYTLRHATGTDKFCTPSSS
jgi:alkylated DNA repair dioxygenase AlkB